MTLTKESKISISLASMVVISLISAITYAVKTDAELRNEIADTRNEIKAVEIKLNQHITSPYIHENLKDYIEIKFVKKVEFDLIITGIEKSLLSIDKSLNEITSELKDRN